MRITIILVAPARAENIGAAARAMKTMGFSELRIVDSQAHLEPATRWVAHGSGDIIDNIKVFQHWLNLYTMSTLLSPPLRVAGRNIITMRRRWNWCRCWRKNRRG